MTIATTVGDALAFEEVDFEILSHKPTYSAGDSARVAGIDGDKLAKAILLKDPQGFVLVVLPATRSLDVDGLGNRLHRHLELASEQDLDNWFCDCAVGAVPPIGPWYRLPTVVDSQLLTQPDIYFEAGDHQELVHVSETSFELLMTGAEYLPCSRGGERH
jgi:Ala-tRNA(Pro) deacylase